MTIAIDRSAPGKLLGHVASTQLVGHLDDAIAAGPLGEHVDASVHDPTEIVGEPWALAVPMLVSGAGGGS